MMSDRAARLFPQCGNVTTPVVLDKLGIKLSVGGSTKPQTNMYVTHGAFDFFFRMKKHLGGGI